MNITMNPERPTPTNSGLTAPRGRLTTDAPTRVFHWLFALCFLGAYLTADGERWRLIHVVLGYTFAGLFVFRLLYGFVGPRSVRWSALWGKIQGLPGWVTQTAQHVSNPGSWSSINWRQGQNLAMTLAIVALLALVIPLTLSGYATYNEWGGEWLEEIHEAVGEFFLFLVLAHVGVILGLSVLRRRNMALPMLTGRVSEKGPDLIKAPRRWLAALIVLGVLSYWTWEWQNAPQSTGMAAASAVGQHGDDDDDD